MEHDRIQFDLKHVPSLRLMRSDSAPLVLGFLHRSFKREQRVSLPYAELVEKLEEYLTALNEQHSDLYPRSAQAYLKQWSDEEHQFLRIYTRGNDVIVELTPDTERAIGWVEDLHAGEFIGTESRFLEIFKYLDDLVSQSTEDIPTRLEQLEKQKAAIQHEIDTILSTGEVARYNTTQIKERFVRANDLARDLLRDFSGVEQNFRSIARSVQEAQLKQDAHKGSVVEYVLNADQELKSSDQGRSFYAFWEFLMSPTKQDELQALLDHVYTLPDLDQLRHDHSVLRRITKSLIEAGEKIVQSNQRLAEQLRRMLDERNLAESRQVRALIADIKHLAHRCVELPPADQAWVLLEGSPDVQLVMEKGLWEPAETLTFAQQPRSADPADLSGVALDSLYSQFYINESLLRRRIDTLLETRLEVTLAEVIDHFPVEKGVSEVIAYCTIAANDEYHLIDAGATEQISVPLIATGDEALVTLPQITFRSKIYGK